MGERTRLFTGDFDHAIEVASQSGRARFGRNVLDDLTSGIDDFIGRRKPQWETHASIGPALLGSAMFLDDGPLIDQLERLISVCVVITKQSGRHLRDAAGNLTDKGHRLRSCLSTVSGLPTIVLPRLSGMAERENDNPLTVGPSWNPETDDIVFPPIRTLGFRKSARHDSPPILHAKLALLGRTWLRDIDTPYGSFEHYGFDPMRLWISSANFTDSSRRNLEFGLWTEDPVLMSAAQMFLAELIAASEPLEPCSDLFDPEFAEVEFDIDPEYND